MSSLADRIQALPNELQREIYLKTLQDRPREPAICFDDAGVKYHHITIREIIDSFPSHIRHIFPRAYALEMLFPNGQAVGSFEGIGSNPHPFLPSHSTLPIGGDPDLRVSAMERSHLYQTALIERDSETKKDFWWLFYLSNMDMKKSRILEQFWSLSNRSDALCRLIRFLTMSYGYTSPGELQSQYNYLGSLTTTQKTEMDSTLNEIVAKIAWIVRKARPALHSRFWLLVPGSMWDYTGYLGHVKSNRRWKGFVRSGAFATYAKHEILSMTAVEFIEMLGDELPALASHRDLLMVNHGLPHGLPQRAHLELHRSSRHGSNYFLTPFGHAMGMNKTEHVLQNRLWAFEEALKLPQGESLSVTGAVPAINPGPSMFLFFRTGRGRYNPPYMWYFNVTHDAYPEWEFMDREDPEYDWDITWLFH